MNSFGVCCLFVVTASTTARMASAVVSQNGTYMQNQQFPSSNAAPGTVSYSIDKVGEGKCCILSQSHCKLLYSLG